MKKGLLLSAIGVLSLAAADSGKITDAERGFLLEQLEQSKKALLTSIANVSPAQWKFKPAPDVWSVQEVAEHLILAEDFLMSTAQQILKSPTVDRPANSNAEFDSMFVGRVQDRSKKATAPEPIVPSGKFATPEDAAREFSTRREKTIAYAKSTQDELRVHVAPGPAGPMDAYQFLLLLAAHTGRHTAQIKEVQANAAYPR